MSRKFKNATLSRHVNVQNENLKECRNGNETTIDNRVLCQEGNTQH